MLAKPIKRIHITEEYGFRYWIWEIEGNLIDIVKYWKTGSVPLIFGFLTPWQEENFPPQSYPGKLFLTKYTNAENEQWDAHAHINGVDDTFLKIKKVSFDHPICFRNYKNST